VYPSFVSSVDQDGNELAGIRLPAVVGTHRHHQRLGPRSAAEAATGLIEGNPILGEIMSRRPEALPEIKMALARQIAHRLGDHPVRCALRAHVFTAHRPAS
jgi:hypothetical protein